MVDERHRTGGAEIQIDAMGRWDSAPRRRDTDRIDRTRRRELEDQVATIAAVGIVERHSALGAIEGDVLDQLGGTIKTETEPRRIDCQRVTGYRRLIGRQWPPIDVVEIIGARDLA